MKDFNLFNFIFLQLYKEKTPKNIKFLYKKQKYKKQKHKK